MNAYSPVSMRARLAARPRSPPHLVDHPGMSFPFALATLLSRPNVRPKIASVRRTLGAESLEDRRLLTITVTFQTSLGNFDVELYDQQAPLTVQNFLNYVRGNDYDGSIFHRSVPG